ncbi:DUF4374 domain-containing protein [Sphingobacterium sp. LRF_L2]|uniref:DUF4374 domain-containing protein n=1 Tax=Sphingobacterium sp. LRF_L2 TaxID=3369421 RepID=UPI003F5EB3BE
MNLKNYSKLALLGIGLTISAACSKSDDNSGEPATGSGSKFLFVVYSDGTSGEAANYIITADDLSSGEVSIKNNGVETSAYSFLVQNNTLFGITYANYGPTQAYQLNSSGEIVKAGNQVNTEFTGAYTPIDDKAYVGVSLSGGISNPEATLYQFDAANYQVSQRKSFSLDLFKTGEFANYTAIKEIGDKLYMPLYSATGVTGKSTSYIDSAWIAVFDKATLTYQKLIRDGRIGPIGNWFGMQGVEQIDNGDVYAWSTSGNALNTALTAKNHSGIIKINASTDAVDASYFFDVEALTGHKIARGNYIKEGKFLMTLYQTDVVGGVSGGIVNLAIVDVINKTVTDVTDIPDHAQMSYLNKVYIDDNGNTAYYVLKNTEGNFYCYKIDVTAATATRGIRFVGVSDVTAISKLTY